MTQSSQPFEFQESWDDETAYEQGFECGARWVREGNDPLPTRWPVTQGRQSDFAQGFAFGVTDAVLRQRGLDPYDPDAIGALWHEWSTEIDRTWREDKRRLADETDVLIPIKGEFNPLKVFSGPPQSDEPQKVIDLFAGPGGWDEAMVALGANAQIYGIDIDGDACATARARGYLRHQSDVAIYDPRRFTSASGLILSPPCPTFSKGGRVNELHYADVQLVADAITGLGSDTEYYTDPLELRHQCSDPRTALAFEIARWALLMPNADWFVVENVPAIQRLYDEIQGELDPFGWSFSSDFIADAADVGAPSLRKRNYLIATRNRPTGQSLRTSVQPRHSMAQALGWPEGERVNTRGQRKTPGGGEFSADQASWCITEKARSWTRVSDKSKLTASETGLLNGFPRDYPWRGPRSKQFLQIADAVNPIIGIAVLGEAMGLDWRKPLLDRLDALYGSEVKHEFVAMAPTADIERPHKIAQPSLFMGL